jgi:hypothetical protein
MMIEVVRSIGDKNLEPEELIRIKHEEFQAIDIEHMVVPVRGAKEFVLWVRTRYRIALATSATPGNLRAASPCSVWKTALISSWTQPAFQSQSPIRRFSREGSSGWKLTPEIAREVCQRTSGTAVLDGSIAQIGSLYSLILKAVSCLNGKTLTSTQAQATDKTHVLNRRPFFRSNSSRRF